MIFQRVLALYLAAPNDQEFIDIFFYELAPYPLSLFDKFGMRKNIKSDLYNFFEVIDITLDKENFYYVIDGGMLLHKIPWKIDEKFSAILSRYINYVKNHFGDCATVVFDGYDNLTTKSSERKRRSRKFMSASYKFNENTSLKVEKTKFLSNTDNKKQLINLLHNSLINNNYNSIQCPGDADRTIVAEAIRNDYSAEKKVVIVAEDIDVLVILTALAGDVDVDNSDLTSSLLTANIFGSQEIYFLKPQSSSGTEPQKIFSNKSLDKHYYRAKEHILFAHAFTGCDTTSAFYRKGKKHSSIS